MNVTTAFFTVVLSTVFSFTSTAQCVEPAMIIATPGAPPNTWSGTGEIGSSFEACESGTVDSIQIRFSPSNTSTSANLILRNVAMIAMGGGSVGATSEYQQSVTFPMGASTQTFVLTTPYPVVKDSSYAWILDGSADEIVDAEFFNNLYPRGGAMEDTGNSTPATNIDLAFRVFITPSSIAPVIPTLGEWGLIILGLVFLISGTLRVKQVRMELA